MSLTVVVLAAGEGKRMKSSVQKVLHKAAGRSLLGHVLASVAPLRPARTIVVTSARKDEVGSSLEAEGFSGLDLVVQDPPRGTADAARVALEALDEVQGQILVVPGDTPLLNFHSLKALVLEHEARHASASFMSARATDPTGYGRVIRDEDGRVLKIVEHREATEQERSVDEINTSVYVFDLERLRDALGKVDDANAQGEFYLTDVVELFHNEGDVVAAYRTKEAAVQGVNSRSQLARVTAELRRRECERLMEGGVTIIDPATTYVDATATVAQDVVIHPFSFIEGATVIQRGAEIGPQARLVDSEVEEGARVSYAVVIESSLGPDSSVGPFASLRPGTRLERGAKLGSFVESKKTVLGAGSKASHLSYLGDTEIGEGVNVGAGTITTNWDGENKHQTVIEDDAYIGSDTMLVAPVRVGRRAATGAGAVVRDDVPDDALAVGVPARIIEGKGNRMKKRDKGKDSAGQ
ncbi:MAG: bifunctional UDP-N-acetylglucosamine diphosphorylase/glucosamine-1-phosphate N-acetyltransferase GlmU [Actinomycetota bacterium]|nr:bifunctional UDP-N-acetylglucosamine diphosphorylase/glucosamine-1-phosphate N-acetyltransferase GlmU [Actinomycetota bacterium]